MHRIIASAIAPLIAAVAFAVTTGAVGGHAQASCTGVSTFTVSDGARVHIPTIGNNTHADNCLLGEGNDSPAVGDLQETLIECYGASIAEDNDFGQATKTALQAAQRREGISADGVYGPVTRDHLHWTDDTPECTRV
jgi:peptidoglycan hydrolase-like protein with peptidoglycan-binding domain